MREQDEHEDYREDNLAGSEFLRNELTRRYRRTAPGAAPGTLISDPDAQPTEIEFICYGPEGMEEGQIESLGDIHAKRDAWSVTWIDIIGVRDVHTIQEMGEMFGLHALALEDVVNLHQRPKAEPYDDHMFLVTRMVAGAPDLSTEQVSMFFKEGLVITVQERAGDSFDPVRARLRRASGQIRRRGADYLAYALIDAILDAYFPALEGIGDRMEGLQGEVMSNPTQPTMARIHELKQDLIGLRRAVWPQRDMLNMVLREEDGFFTEATKTYLRDTYDHCVQLVDLIETYRELSSALTDLYISMNSAKTNEVMRVLTMVATVFIPLSFIAGIYGMNFDPASSPFNMPELGWYLGYPFALGLMLAVALGLVWMFRRKGWIGPPPVRRRRIRFKRRS